MRWPWASHAARVRRLTAELRHLLGEPAVQRSLAALSEAEYRAWVEEMNLACLRAQVVGRRRARREEDAQDDV